MIYNNINMVSYGREQLQKYGWKKGKGLGRNEHGMTEAIKPKLKFDAAGLGHDQAEQFTFHWWDHIYNKASQNIHVDKSENGHIEIKRNDKLEVSTKRPSKFKIESGKGLYDYFVKGSILENSTETQISNQSKNSECNIDAKDYSSNLSDERLFQICGGQTAHKGARHGLKMTAKLARLKMQEEKLLNISSENVKTETQNLNNSHFNEDKTILSETCDDLKPILKENTPINSGKNRRKSVQFSEEIKLKIFSYRYTDDKDFSIKMETKLNSEQYLNSVSLNSTVIELEEVPRKKSKKKLKKEISDHLLLTANTEDIVTNFKDNLDSLIDPNEDSLRIVKKHKKKKSRKGRNLNRGDLINEDTVVNMSNITIFDNSNLVTSEDIQDDLLKVTEKKKSSGNNFVSSDTRVNDLQVILDTSEDTLANGVVNKFKSKKMKKSKPTLVSFEADVNQSTTELNSHLSNISDSLVNYEEKNIKKKKKKYSGTNFVSSDDTSTLKSTEDSLSNCVENKVKRKKKNSGLTYIYSEHDKNENKTIVKENLSKLSDIQCDGLVNYEEKRVKEKRKKKSRMNLVCSDTYVSGSLCMIDNSQDILVNSVEKIVKKKSESFLVCGEPWVNQDKTIVKDKNDISNLSDIQCNIVIDHEEKQVKKKKKKKSRMILNDNESYDNDNKCLENFTELNGEDFNLGLDNYEDCSTLCEEKKKKKKSRSNLIPRYNCDNENLSIIENNNLSPRCDAGHLDSVGICDKDKIKKNKKRKRDKEESEFQEDADVSIEDSPSKNKKKRKKFD